jgi:hypothetical protein
MLNARSIVSYELRCDTCMCLLTVEALVDTLQVSGDIRAVFYDKSGGHLFNVCFNTFFISNSMLQVSC